jgi:6-phosphofructokinase 1
MKAFEVQRLGPATFHSPLRLSSVLGDKVADYVPDDERVLLHSSLRSWEKYRDRGEEPPSMEVAGPREFIYFDPKSTCAAVVTCGGLCPGLNDVIRGLVMSLHYDYGVRRILGIRYGYYGLTEHPGEVPVSLTPESVEDIDAMGGSMLGSSRGEQDVVEMVDFMVRRKINILFTVGGDGTQRGGLAITREAERRSLPISVVGIPKTIDNDIMYVQRTFGFETAFSVAKDVVVGAHAEAVGALNGICIVKLMGRHAGFLATMATIASGDVNFLLIPEVPFELDGEKGFLAALERRILERRHALVVVAEGAGQDLLSDEVKKLGRDPSGNIRLADIGQHLRRRVEQYFASRSISVTVRYIDPSYYVRSLPAVPTDKVFCQQLAGNAVHAAMSGRTGIIVGLWNDKFTHVPTEAVVSRRKQVDSDGPLWLAAIRSTGQPAKMVN